MNESIFSCKQPKQCRYQHIWTVCIVWISSLTLSNGFMTHLPYSPVVMNRNWRPVALYYSNHYALLSYRNVDSPVLLWGQLCCHLLEMEETANDVWSHDQWLTVGGSLGFPNKQWQVRLVLCWLCNVKTSIYLSFCWLTARTPVPVIKVWSKHGGRLRDCNEKMYLGVKSLVNINSHQLTSTHYTIYFVLRQFNSSTWLDIIRGNSVTS